MGLEKLLNDTKVIAVVCNQWGDTGKGKFSDYFASQWAEVTARGTGGNNAGHTVVVNGQERIFHLLPAGITNDCDGQITVLGNGMVIDVPVLIDELNDLDSEGMSYDNLRISKDAHVILPYHIERDRARHQSQANGGIGSTGRGIGPSYTDKIARRGITIGDLFDTDVLAEKIEKAIASYPEQVVNVGEVIDEVVSYRDRIKPFVRDTVSDMHRFVRKGKRILIEGAQGLLLSVEHGSYPYVTSSDCSLNGTANGVGLPATAVDLPLGIVKFPFMTRVGAGPFPTELGGARSEIYCGEDDHTKLQELGEHGIPYDVVGDEVSYNLQHEKIVSMMNSRDPFTQGIGIRLAAREYGATTGRPRRTGWVDAVAAKYAVGVNGPLMILTKPDSIAGADEFNVCYGYRSGQTVTDFNKDERFLRGVTPELKTYEGYGDIMDVRRNNDLPTSLQEAVGDFEQFTGGRVVAVSVGPDREETIVR
jgi:adenylosuccinate synthase